MFDEKRWKVLQVKMHVFPTNDPYGDQLAEQFFDELVKPNLESPDLGEIFNANDGPHFGNLIEMVLNKSADHVNSVPSGQLLLTAAKCEALDLYTQIHLGFLLAGLRDGRTPPHDPLCYSVQDGGFFSIIPKGSLERIGSTQTLHIFEERTPPSWFEDKHLSIGEISSKFWRVSGGYAKYLQEIIRTNKGTS